MCTKWWPSAVTFFDFFLALNARRTVRQVTGWNKQHHAHPLLPFNERTLGPCSNQVCVGKNVVWWKEPFEHFYRLELPIPLHLHRPFNRHVADIVRYPQCDSPCSEKNEVKNSHATLIIRWTPFEVEFELFTRFRRATLPFVGRYDGARLLVGLQMRNGDCWFSVADHVLNSVC